MRKSIADFEGEEGEGVRANSETVAQRGEGSFNREEEREIERGRSTYRERERERE